MSREPRLYLIDMRNACSLIVNWSSGVPEDAFAHGDVRYHACLQQLVVLGEAAKAIPEQIRQGTPDVPWASVAGLRDVIAHGYFALEAATVRQICIERVPELLSVVTALLDEMPSIDGED